MGSPFNPIRSVKGPTIHGVIVTAQITCGCGSPIPLQVVFMPGVELKAVCPACKLNFKLMKLAYDEKEAPGGMRVSVGHYEPAIIPATQLPMPEGRM